MMKRIVILLFCMAVLYPMAGVTQVDPSIEQGIHPFGSYDATKVDTVNLQNGGVSVKIPLFSYPERGKFGATVDLILSSKQWGVNLYCDPSTGVCEGNWEIINRTGAPLRDLYPNVMGMGVVIDDGLPSRGTTYQYVEDSNGHYRQVPSFVVVDADASAHPMMGGVTTSPAGDTIDGTATAYLASTNAITTRNGVSSADSSNPPYLTVEDSNGNIEMTTTAGTAGEDSMGRAGLYSALQNAQTLTPSGDNLLGCAGPASIVDVKLVTFPGFNGPSRLLKLCSVVAHGQTNFQQLLWDPGNPGDEFPIAEGTFGGAILQSASLYDGNSWSTSPTWIFQYSGTNPIDGSNYLDLTQITFPTGGTISYSWDTESNPFICGYAFVSRYVISRTVSANDGSPNQVYSYSYFPTTVTDAQGNVVKHYFNSVTSGTCNQYETETQWFNSSGQMLKQVQTDYSGVLDPFFPETQPNFDVNVFPIRTTTTLPNGMVSKVETDYDSTLSVEYWDPYWVDPDTGNLGTLLVNGNLSRGLALQKREYAYGNGAPGTLIRCTAYDYQALDSSTYMNANLLDLPSSVKVYAGACGGTLVSQTTYGYDETSVQSSGVMTQLASVSGVRGNQTSVHKSLNTGGTINTYTSYWDTGMPYQSTDGNGNTTTYSYSLTYAGGLLTQTQMPTTGTVQHIVSAGYDLGTGMMTSYTDQNSNTTNFGYDGLTRMTSASFPDTGLTTLTYPPGIYTSVTETVLDGKITTTNFDGLGRKSHVIVNDSPQNDTVDYTYDSLGNLAGVSNPYRSTGDPSYGITSFTYDGLGRKLTQTQPDSSTLTWIYNASGTTGGDVTDYYDETSRHWQRTTDAFSNLIQVKEPDSSDNPTIETDYTYNALNDLTRIDQWGGTSGSSGDHVRTFTYDSVRRLLSATHPESGTTSYTYDNNNNMLTKTDARGITTTLTYDPLNRPLSKTYSDATYPASYTYDTSNGHNSLNIIGHLTDEKTTAGGVTMTERAIDQYDSMGRLKSERQCFVGGCGAQSFTLTHQYSRAGDVIASNNGLSDTHAITLNYSYDGTERLQSVVSSLNDATHPATLFTAQQYGPIGLLQGNYAIPSGGTTAAYTQTLGYDTRERITGETDATTAASPVTLYAYALSYYANNDIQTVTDTVMGQWGYTYDSLNRLAQGTSTAGTYSGLTLSWSYDAFGNRLSQTASGTYGGTVPQPGPVSFSSANNRVDQWGYDAAGEVQSDGTNFYEYDAEGRQTGTLSTASGLTGYVYDAEGRRVMKVVVNGFGGPNPSTTVEDEYLLGLAGEQVTVLDGNNNWQWTNVYANGRVMATYDPSGTQFTLGDWLGTKRVIANVTAPLTVSTTQCTSLPYGDGLSCTGADTNQLHFTGKERDVESTNDYFLARYYASNIAGRFLTPDDSSSPQAMPYADLSNPQSFNRYVYLNDNPVGGVDADGHQTTDNNGNTCGADNVKDHLTHGQANALCASANTKQQASKGSTSIQTVSATTATPGILLGGAIGEAIFPPGGGVAGAILGSTVGVGVTGSYVPSTDSYFGGVTATFSPVLLSGTGVSASDVIVPAGQDPNSIANGPSYSATFQPTPLTGSTVVKSPGAGSAVAGPAIGTRVPVAFGASYNINITPAVNSIKNFVNSAIITMESLF